jgi:hypothetical protein
VLVEPVLVAPVLLELAATCSLANAERFVYPGRIGDVAERLKALVC